MGRSQKAMPGCQQRPFGVCWLRGLEWACVQVVARRSARPDMWILKLMCYALFFCKEMTKERARCFEMICHASTDAAACTVGFKSYQWQGLVLHK